MRVLLSAGEASGDRLGAALVRALRERAPELEFEGIAGPAMRAEGVRAIARVEDLGVMGLFELLSALPRIWRTRRAAVGALERRPQLFVPIDAPDFNLPLLRVARAEGVPSVLLGSPQVWAWRGGRARDIAGLAREVLCLLPFEPPWYTRAGGQASFVGHPLADLPPMGPPGQDWAILPGSREGEIRRLLPQMVEAARILQARVPGARVRLPLAPTLRRETLEAAADLRGIEVVGSVAEAVEPARACLVASGSATLELACLGRPMAVCYRVHPLSYGLGRLLVRGVKFIALPNLIAGRPVVPELLQRFSSEELVDAWMGATTAQLPELAAVREAVRGPGAAERAAERVLAALRGTA